MRELEMTTALALLELDSVPIGLLAVDRMMKQAPVTLLRCGTVHPGRYLALVGGSVGSTEEAHREGVRVGQDEGMLIDDVCLADPHPELTAAVTGQRRPVDGDTVGVLETTSSPALLRALDALLKAVPVHLVEARLADDIGGRAVALLDGELADIQHALELAMERLGPNGQLRTASVMPRIDPVLREALAESSRFATCSQHRFPDGEQLEEA
jgi:microcompartment protein CcmL/EutN